MRTITLALAALLSLPGAASAQARVDVHFDLPVVLPPLVVIQPGVQVVPQVQEEVFFHDGWYWARRDRGWWRTRDHRGGWVMVPVREVPPPLVRLPPGHYRNWKAEKEAEKRERRAAKRQRKEERREEREHDRGHGHGNGHDHGRGQGRD